MSRTRGLLNRIGHYTIAKSAIMAAGLVSYPILTRVLEPGEYGVMGLIIGLLNLTIGVSKLGLQFSTVRLWAQWADSEARRQSFILSFFCATVLASVTVMALYDAVTLAVSPWLNESLAFFILLSSPLILIRALQSFGLALLNAREWSRPYALFEVAIAYAAMILAVLGAAVVIGGLTGYYIGLIAGETMIVVTMMIYVLRSTRFRRHNLNYPLVREAAAFGFPMALYEMSGVLFYNGDRIIVLWLLDKVQLGYYTVAHNLSMYIHVLFGYPVMMAVTPAVTSLYEKESPAAASDFLRMAARWFFLFSMAAVAGMCMIRGELLELLASSKFIDSADMMPILLAGLLISGSRDILGAGLFLKKRPWMMAGMNLSGASLNALLNLLLIPVLRIEGAALATLLTQTIITVVFWILGSRFVPVSLDVRRLFLHMLCALAMAGVLYFITFDSSVLRLVIRLPLGALVFGLLLVTVDADARRVAKKFIGRFTGGGDADADESSGTEFD